MQQTYKTDNRQSRIVQLSNGAIAHRVIFYKTSMGENSAGYDVNYDSFESAKEKEKTWVFEEE